MCFDCAAVDIAALARKIERKIGQKPHQLVVESRQLVLYWDKTTGHRFNYWQRKLTYQVNKARTKGRVVIAKLVTIKKEEQ